VLRLAAFGDAPGPVVDVRRDLVLPARAALTLSAFELIGRFFDLTYAYRFGPLVHRAVFVQLLSTDGGEISQAVYMPPAAAFADPGGGVEARLAPQGRAWSLILTAERFQPYVHVCDPAFRPSDDGFALAPGEPKAVRLLRRDETASGAAPQGEILALGGRLAGGYGGA